VVGVQAPEWQHFLAGFLAIILDLFRRTDFACSAAPMKACRPEVSTQLLSDVEAGQAHRSEALALMMFFAGYRMMHYSVHDTDGEFSAEERAEVMFLGMAILLAFQLTDNAKDSIVIQGFAGFFMLLVLEVPLPHKVATEDTNKHAASIHLIRLKASGSLCCLWCFFLQIQYTTHQYRSMQCMKEIERVMNVIRVATHGLMQELEKLFGLLSALFRGSHREISTLDALVAVSKIQHLRRLYIQCGRGRVQWNNPTRGYKSLQGGSASSQPAASPAARPAESVFAFLDRMVKKYTLCLAALGFQNSIMMRSFTSKVDVAQASQR
jgi:hypothetical protein